MIIRRRAASCSRIQRQQSTSLRSQTGTLQCSVSTAAVSLILLGGFLAWQALACGPSWDEGILWRRGLRAGHWIDAHWKILRNSRSESHPTGRPPSLSAAWNYINQHEGHPCGHAWVVFLANQLPGHREYPLATLRIPPVTVFLLGVAGLQYRLFINGLRSAGILVPLIVIGFPRLLGHARLGCLDGLETACWMLAWACQPRTTASRTADVAWGGLLGLAVSVKATGLGLLPGSLVQAFRFDRMSRFLVCSLPTALLVFIMANPPCWPAPVAGIAEFCERNTIGRGHLGFTIGQVFLGQRYPDAAYLPVWATLWNVATMIPVLVIVLSVHGFSVLRFHLPRESLPLIVHVGILPALQMIPGVPGHDGLRLILPSLSLIVVPAAIAIVAIIGKQQRLGMLLLIMLPFSLAGRTLLTAPLLLSDFNHLVGGTAGSVDWGMEPAYSWEAFDRTAAKQISDDPSSTNCIVGYPSENLALLGIDDQSGHWFCGSLLDEADRYVLQHRPGHLDMTSRFLFAFECPIWTASTAGCPFSSDRRTVVLAAFDHASIVRARKTIRGTVITTRVTERTLPHREKAVP